MKYRVRIGGIAAAAVVLMLGACGNPIAHTTAAQTVRDAFTSALAGPGINLQVSVAVTPQQLRQISQLSQRAHPGTSVMPGSAGSQMSIVVNVYPGGGESTQSAQFATDPNNQLDFAIQLGQETPLEVRYVAGVLYARADLASLLSQSGSTSASAGQIGSALQKAKDEVPGLAALGEGGWVSTNLSNLSPLLNAAGINASVMSKAGAATVTMLSHFESALTVKTTYTNLGDQGGRTEYQLTLPGRKFLKQLGEAVSNDIANLAGGTPIPGASSMGNQLGQAINQAVGKVSAGQTVKVQAWLKDNKIQEVDLDLNQFDHELPFAVPLHVLLAPASHVTPPATSTPLNLPDVGALIGGLMGGNGSSA
jgi:hypothetical protein